MSLQPLYEYNGNNISAAIENAPELIAMTAREDAVYSGNVIDTTGKTAPGTTLDGTIHFVMDDGTYYSNPWATNTGKGMLLYPRDASDNAITMTREDGTVASYLELVSVYLYKLTIAGLSIDLLGYINQDAYDGDERTVHRQYTLSAEPDHWQLRGDGYTAGGSIDRGLTKGSYSTTYIAYAAPTVQIVYTDGLESEIASKVVTLKNYVLEPSANLLDYSKINWHPVSGYYRLDRDYYMPVTPGTVIETNNTQGHYYFYNASYTQLETGGTVGFSTPYLPVTVPQGAAWARITFSSSYVAEGDPIMVWVARSELSAKYERPIYRPDVQLKPQYMGGAIFDYAVPTALSQGVVKMARFAALRAANERQNAYRFGTYNTYVSRGDNGFYLLREMAFDYALDFMGTQECSYPGTTLQSAMYQFQFPYGTPEMHVDESQRNIPVPSVSRFEIVSVKDILLKESRHCLRVTVNLPQNKHYPRVPTLSVYNYHGSLSKANRLEEIQTMLDEIAEDTADFIVVMGDTNSEVDQQGHRQSWDAWENAGFTAVHHGESPTWPSQVNPSNYSSMDNIFVSSHINVLGYNIVPWQNYLLPGDLPLSDHDMVYADLQFDFDAVLKDTWEEPATVT